MTRLTVVSFFVISLMFVGISYAEIDQETCVGMWLLDENADDSSGNNNHGTIMGNPELVDGKFGKALKFNGSDDYVEIPSSDSLNINEQITLVVWGYVEALDGDGDQWIDRGGHARKPNCYGIYYRSEGYAQFMLGDGSARHNADSAEPPATGKWVHIAGTYDGASQILYFDGAIVGENNEAFSFRGDNNLSVIIGKGVDRDNYAFNGSIDEVAVFNVALTADDINDIMTAGLSGALGMTAVSPSGKLATTWSEIKK